MVDHPSPPKVSVTAGRNRTRYRRHTPGSKSADDREATVNHYAQPGHSPIPDTIPLISYLSFALVSFTRVYETHP